MTNPSTTRIEGIVNERPESVSTVLLNGNVYFEKKEASGIAINVDMSAESRASSSVNTRRRYVYSSLKISTSAFPLSWKA